MKMKVIDTLRSVFAIIDRDTKATGAFFLSQFLRHIHQMSQQGFLILPCLGELRQTVALLGNDEKMNGSLGINVAKGETKVIVVNDVRRDGALNDLIKDGNLLVVVLLVRGLLGLFNFIRRW